MNLGIHVHKNPAGTYSFAGTIPVDCSFYYRENPDARISEEDIKTIRHCGPGLLRHKIGTRCFTTKADAWEFYEKLMIDT